jgi:predicted hotdog family 3-hydroxylacyl-ACP dehydratase
MRHAGRSPLLAQAFSCWNWKCALLSATARSLAYLAALARSGPHGRLSIILVEIAYVALTAGVYAGLQQRALGLRARWLGNLIIALGVPALAQILDWLAHRAVGAAVPFRAILAVSIFAALSALFHLYVMRRGVFLTNHGRSLVYDFRRIPRLIAGFVVAPVALFALLAGSATRATESETAL